MSKGEWPIVRFGDMVHHIGERIHPDDAGALPYVGLEHLNPESLKIRRWGNPDDVGATKLRFYAGDIIFGKRRFYQRKLVVADFDGICSAHAMVLRAKRESMLPEFLPFFMQTELFFDRAMSISVGALSPTINWTALARQEFPLPPLDEQRRIAELLWAVENLIEEYLTLYEQAKHFLWVIFHHLFYPADIPAHWDVLPLKKCVVQNNTSSQNPHVNPIYLGLEHLESGAWQPIAYDDSAKYTSNCHIFYEGDLLYGKLRPNLDKCIIAPYDGVCSTEILVLNATHITSNEYLLYHFHSPHFILHNAHRAYGTKMPRTSFDILSRYTIPIPPLDEQTAILDIMRAIQLALNKVTDHILSTNALKKKLLGELIETNLQDENTSYNENTVECDYSA